MTTTVVSHIHLRISDEGCAVISSCGRRAVYYKFVRT